MKKNIVLVIITIFMTNMTNAQNNPTIAGIYSLGSSSPEGGSHLIVLENGYYAIMYFGGMQTGKWQLTKDTIYRFSPHIKESKFELFGRHNKNLKGKTKIFFSGFENSPTFIHLSSTKEENYTMKQVFNSDANCFSFPYVHTFKIKANNISLMFEKYGEDPHPITTFKNPEGFNDFIAYFIEVETYEARPFFATFKEDALYFEDKNNSLRKPLDKEDEEIEFIKNMIEKETSIDIVYFNPSYNMFGGPDSEETRDIHEHHKFNEEKNAFIDAEYYVEGEEHIKSDASFDNMSIIYAYTILKEHSKETAKFKIDEKPIFQVNCD